MSHGLDSCLSVLRRWAAHSEQPLPTDWAGFAERNPSEALRLQAIDPQLVSLLAGTAGAGLRADAITGDFSSVPPDPEAIAEQQRQARIEELMAQAPWGTQSHYDSAGQLVGGSEPCLTAQLELAVLAPEIYAQQQALHQPQPTAEAIHAQREATAQAEATARLQSMQTAFPLTNPLGGR